MFLSKSFIKMLPEAVCLSRARTVSLRGRDCNASLYSRIEPKYQVTKRHGFDSHDQQQKARPPL
jgi:hypothetical protein